MCMCWPICVHVSMSVCAHMRLSLLFQSACVCAYIYDGPVVFDDDIAYVTNAADCKYCICCVVFGLWLVLFVFCCCVEQATMVCVYMLFNVCAYVHVCMCAYAFVVVVSIGVRLCISSMDPWCSTTTLHM